MFVYIIHESRDISLTGRNKEDWRVTTSYGVSVKSVHIKHVHSNSTNEHR